MTAAVALVVEVDFGPAETAFERAEAALSELDRIQLARRIGRAIAHLPRTQKRRRLGHHLFKTAPRDWRNYTLTVGTTGECWDHAWTRDAGVGIDASLANDY